MRCVLLLFQWEITWIGEGKYNFLAREWGMITLQWGNIPRAQHHARCNPLWALSWPIERALSIAKFSDANYPSPWLLC